MDNKNGAYRQQHSRQTGACPESECRGSALHHGHQRRRDQSSGAGSEQSPWIQVKAVGEGGGSGQPVMQGWQAVRRNGNRHGQNNGARRGTDGKMVITGQFVRGNARTQPSIKSLSSDWWLLKAANGNNTVIYAGGDQIANDGHAS